MKLGQRGQTGIMELLIGGLIAGVLVYALAPTIVNRSENAADDVERFANGENLDDGYLYSDRTAAPLHRLGPMFWAVVGVAVMAGVILGALRYRG